MAQRSDQKMPKVKLSGVLRPADAEAAAARGITHIGCVFNSSSPRNVETPALAKEIFRAAGKQVTPVLEFRGHSRNAILEICRLTGVRNIQVAGINEAEALALQREKLMVSRVYELTSVSQLLPAQKPEPTSKAPSLFTLATTGTELTFPWELLGELAPANTFIGGGVRPENVRALLTHDPWGINLCAGVERRPGELDVARLEMIFEPLQEAR